MWYSVLAGVRAHQALFFVLRRSARREPTRSDELLLEPVMRVVEAPGLLAHHPCLTTRGAFPLHTTRHLTRARISWRPRCSCGPWKRAASAGGDAQTAEGVARASGV